MADMGALLNAVSVFPGLSEAFDFKSLKSLSGQREGHRLSETFLIGAKGATKEAVLMDLGGKDALQVLIEYHDENGEPTAASVEVIRQSRPAGAFPLSAPASQFTSREIHS